MKKFALFAVMMSIFLSSCATIHITTIPKDATIHLGGSETTVAPCDVGVWWFSRRKAKFSHKGFADHSCDLSWGTSRDLQVVLNRELTIGSRPDGAEVAINGEPVGQTPCKAILPATVQAAEITIALQGYQTKHIKFNLERSTGELNVILSKDGPGRRMMSIGYDASGFPIFKEETINGEEDAESSDGSELVAFMENTRFPLYLRSFGSSDALLVTIVEPKNNRRYRNILYNILLYRLDCKNGGLTPMLSGYYFEHNGVISKNFLFYSSFQTGRFDLWKLDTASPTPVPILLLTNTLIKTELDVANDDRHILFTAYKPSKPKEPHVWLYVPGSTTSAELISISEGTYPAWAPDARHFLFQKNSPGRIAKADMDGSNIHVLNDFIGKHRDMHPAWSPDGKLIAFSSNRGNDSPDNFDIWIMDCNGDNPRRITTSSSRDDSPVFSPDGRSIYFRSNRNLTWGIWKIPVDQAGNDPH